jgi:hypothetical protein
MRLYQLLDEAIQYLSEAIVRIFSPSDDAYPMVGTQPYSGDPFLGNGEEW